MERLEKSGVVGAFKQPETTTDLFLKWGNKKRVRCVRMKDPDDAADPSYAVSGRRNIRRRINSRFVTYPSHNNNSHNNNNSYNNNINNNNNNNNDTKQPSVPPPPTRLTRNSETAVHLRSENHRKPSPDKEVSRPTVSLVTSGVGDQKMKHVWPKLYITLSSKEKEEDFMAMKGCKPPHRPKKRPKAIQRSLLLVSPGAWLTEICQDRYDVIEKKNTKKRPTGLKAMGGMESDSE